jgi:hypothetical protein
MKNSSQLDSTTIFTLKKLIKIEKVRSQFLIEIKHAFSWNLTHFGSFGPFRGIYFFSKAFRKNTFWTPFSYNHANLRAKIIQIIVQFF